MSRISNAFKKEKVFISFLTAGDPSISDSVSYIKTLIKNGSGLVEIGLPFSDPVAEGPVIERANYRALVKPTTTDDVFEIIRQVRLDDQVTPLAILTYLNPVFVYGIDKFLSKAKEVGLDALIIPDLPYEENNIIKTKAKELGIDLITLIAPTSKERIRKLASSASGFIYLVSSMGVTGVRETIKSDLKSLISEIRDVSDVPIAVGFGIATAQQAQAISADSDGVIIGSAIVKIIEKNKNDATTELASFSQAISQAINPK